MQFCEVGRPEVCGEIRHDELSVFALGEELEVLCERLREVRRVDDRYLHFRFSPQSLQHALDRAVVLRSCQRRRRVYYVSTRLARQDAVTETSKRN